MKDLVLHADTQAQVEACIDASSHGVILVGPPGSGKISIAEKIARGRLKLDVLTNYPYYLHIQPDRSAISIDSVREIDQFLTLKVPGGGECRRVIIIEQAECMGHEAQNALLKNLEEPPLDTLILLTTAKLNGLLPTIRSRIQTIHVIPPGKKTLAAYFSETEKEAFERAYAMSAGRVGLLSALLTDSEHPLRQAAEYARRLLTLDLFDRLCLVDELARQSNLAIDMTALLGQMAHIGLKTASKQASRRWQAILGASYHAHEALSKNGQAKLVLTNLMLHI